MNTDPRRHEIQYCAEEIISFAQNAEDVLIFRAFRGKRAGCFVDIGAGHPIADNVTQWLRMMGWAGVNIEPNPIFHRELELYRPDDTNLNIGISDHEGMLQFFQVLQNEVGHGWGLSSFDPRSEQLAAQLGYSTRHLEVFVRPLNDVIKGLSLPRVDLLKMDVEGLESAIIRSTDWRSFRPRLICIEAVKPNSSKPSWMAWERLLIEADYEFAMFDGANGYYVANGNPDVRGQLTAGVNYCDHWRRATVDDFPAPPVRTRSHS